MSKNNITDDDMKLVRNILSYDISKRKSLFEMLTHSYKHENYHSDIIRYYLSYDFVVKKFIDWLNRSTVVFKNHDGCTTYLEKKIDFTLYKDIYVPERENGKRDITIYSNPDCNHKRHVIIIENKSNEAGDMDEQIQRYYSDLKNDFIIDAILYLKKYFIELPKDIDSWEDRKAISKILVVATLNRENGFVENLVNTVLKDLKSSISDCDDYKILGLSEEIKSLFYILEYGEYEVDNMEQFIHYLFTSHNLSKLSNVYRKLPDFIRNYFECTIETEFSIFQGFNLNYRYGSSCCNSYCVRFENKGIIYVIEFQFCEILNEQLIVRVFLDNESVLDKVSEMHENAMAKFKDYSDTNNDFGYFNFNVSSIDDIKNIIKKVAEAHSVFINRG